MLGYHHHGHDVVAGGIIGLTMAFFGYRMCFASILDPRWNTVPLTRNHDPEFEDRAGDEYEGKRRGLASGHAGRVNGLVNNEDSRDVSPA